MTGAPSRPRCRRRRSTTRMKEQWQGSPRAWSSPPRLCQNQQQPPYSHREWAEEWGLGRVHACGSRDHLPASRLSTAGLFNYTDVIAGVIREAARPRVYRVEASLRVSYGALKAFAFLPERFLGALGAEPPPIPPNSRHPLEARHRSPMLIHRSPDKQPCPLYLRVDPVDRWGAQPRVRGGPPPGQAPCSARHR